MASNAEKKSQALRARLPLGIPGPAWRGLVVDDDKASRSSVMLALEGEELFGRKLHIDFASSAKEAMERLSEDSGFVFAILDVMMEELDSGLVLVDWIRSRSELDTLRIAMRTGYSGGDAPDEVIQKYDILDYRQKTDLSRGKLLALVAALVRSWVEISSTVYGERSMAALAAGVQDLGDAHSAPYFLLALEKAGRAVLDPGVFTARLLAGEPSAGERVISGQGLLPDIVARFDSRMSWASQTKAARRLLASAQSSYARLSAVKRLEAMAYADPVTGLANRRRLMQWLERDLEEGEAVGVMIMDVDHFKRVNDRLGHEAGDKLLKVIGERMSKACESVPSRAARLGGDEFCVLFRCASEPEAFDCAVRWLDEIGGAIALGSEACDPKFSAGLAWSESSLPGEALRNADVAMYRAKKSGRGRLCLFEPGAGAETPRPKREREQRLAKGLADGELLALFQPLVNTKDGSFLGFEVFARWRRPGEDIVMAGDFLPMAQEAGVSREIDRWMAERALEARRALGGEAQMRINIDSKQACDETFAKELGRMWSGEKCSALAVEMLESAALTDIERFKSSCAELFSAGIEASIDSFGAGSASLGVLSKVLPASVKIDAGMLRGADSRNKSLLARSIAASAQIHGIACIGTGVESFEEAKTLLSWGVEVMQGHAIGAPMEWDAALEWLGQWKVAGSKKWLDLVRN